MNPYLIWLAAWLIVLLQIFLRQSSAYDIRPPVHQYIAMEATKVWKDIPEEIINHASRSINSRLDGICSVNFDSQDDIIIASGEEDREKNPLECPLTNEELQIEGKPTDGPTHIERCLTNEGRNGYMEHYWDPDQPNIGGYNCNAGAAAHYNQGLIFSGLPLLPDPDLGHYDSAYRLAQDLWDNKIIPLYKTGTDEGKAEAYYWLGRVVHLLADMTVPAHVHLIPHARGLAGKDFYESLASRVFKKYRGDDPLLIGREYKFECLPNLPCDFNWQEVHPNPTDLFKLLWYTAQKTQYFASRTKGSLLPLPWPSPPLQAVGNSWYVRPEDEKTPVPFNPPLWEGEAAPVQDPEQVPEHLEEIADALVPHVIKAVAGLYRLFWRETHPPPDLSACAPRGWSVIGSGTGQWQCSGEALLAHSSAGDSILASSTVYTDVTLSAVVSSQNREASLAVRMQDAANGYIIIFIPDGIPWNNGQGGIWVARRVGYQESYPAYYHEPGFPSLGQLAQLSVSVNGPVIKVILNGREVLQVTDTTYGSGRIGLRINGDVSFPCDSTFTNITVIDY